MCHDAFADKKQTVLGLLVRKDMDVYEHEILYNIRPRNKLKLGNIPFIAIL
jgi:hypothetical protein